MASSPLLSWCGFGVRLRIAAWMGDEGSEERTGEVRNFISRLAIPSAVSDAYKPNRLECCQP